MTEPGATFVTVILEAAFVLRSAFRCEQRDIARSMVDLLSRANVVTVELPKDAVVAAVARGRDGTIGSVGDALLAACLQTHEAGRFVTFDRRFRRDLGVEIVYP